MQFATGSSAVIDQGATPFADFLTLSDPSGNVIQVMESYAR